MGIFAVVEADHQPRGSLGPLAEGPADATAHGGNGGRMEGDVQAMGAGEGRQSGEVLEGGQVVVAGTTDPFAPAPLEQCLVRIDPGISRR